MGAASQPLTAHGCGGLGVKVFRQAGRPGHRASALGGTGAPALAQDVLLCSVFLWEV